ncbi:MAG: ATPase, T2SS/T4P/T4SS family, partial [Elusimicrobiota bacterium]
MKTEKAAIEAKEKERRALKEEELKKQERELKKKKVKERINKLETEISAIEERLKEREAKITEEEKQEEELRERELKEKELREKEIEERINKLEVEKAVIDARLKEREARISGEEKEKEVVSEKKNLVELDFYPVNEPFAYVKILKDTTSLDKYYKVIEPQVLDKDFDTLNLLQDKLINSIDIRLDELKSDGVNSFLAKQINQMIKNHEMKADELLKKKFLYYIKREFLDYGKIDPLMRDPNIEDISCDGSEVPVFLYHRRYGSLKSNVLFNDEEELSAFVIKLAQKCGKHISLAEPMLDATMPDGSRIQMTLSKTVTTKGSTFTIRKFRSDPITATDLIDYNTLSPEMVAYMWMAVENGVNALIAGGTAAGKTSTLNALSLFIPKESKIVSIEETREINLPHPNWIPGVVRSGFGEVLRDKLAGEIDLYDLMKAALRQRPEYILVGEIRGKEAYVLFQAMATGHTTYSTFHADSPKAVIHRLEGKPINVPRVMLQSLDVIFIQVSASLGDKRVRRCKQIVEIIDIDPTTKEILTNEVFSWDPVEDKFNYSGKSYIFERIRNQHDITKEGIMEEVRRRVKVLEWMRENNIRVFKDVARVVSFYAENPDDLMKKIAKDPKMEKKTDKETKKLGKIKVNKTKSGKGQGKKKQTSTFQHKDNNRKNIDSLEG